MSDPSSGNGPPQASSGIGILLGIVFAAPVLTFLTIVIWADVGAPVGMVVIVAAAVGAVLLVAKGDPFARGFGIGTLIGGSILGVLAGSCAAMLSSL